jgi:hypothetical protein
MDRVGDLCVADDVTAELAFSKLPPSQFLIYVFRGQAGNPPQASSGTGFQVELQEFGWKDEA